MLETNSKSETSSTWNGPDRRGPSRQDDETRARKLLAEVRAGGSGAAAARDALVLQFRPLVQKQARKFFTSAVPLEDLVQEGFLGLMHGIDQYDPVHETKLITYATHHIDGHLRHFLRDRTQIIKEPAWLQEMAQKVRRETEALTQTFGREPSDAEVASALGVGEPEVARVRATRSRFDVRSLEQAQESGSSRVQVAESNAEAAQAELPIEEKIVLEDALSRLKEIERKVIYSFYYEDRSQTDIARALGVSNNYVSHILKNSARKIQQMLRSDAVREAALRHEHWRRRVIAYGRDAHPEDAEAASRTVVDPVTSLYTRFYFAARLDEEVSRASRHQLELTVIRLRVDSDLPEAALFVRIAQVTKECMRGSDIIARYDDRELIALLPHTGATRETVVGRLHAQLGTLIPTFPHPCVLSLGRASYPAQRLLADLVKAAAPNEIIAIRSSPEHE